MRQIIAERRQAEQRRLAAKKEAEAEANRQQLQEEIRVYQAQVKAVRRKIAEAEADSTAIEGRNQPLLAELYATVQYEDQQLQACKDLCVRLEQHCQQKRQVCAPRARCHRGSVQAKGVGVGQCQGHGPVLWVWEWDHRGMGVSAASVAQDCRDAP